MEGTVKWFNGKKGFGFVAGDDGQEYFVHKSALSEGTFIRENDKVSFDPAEGDKGKQAQNVKLLQKGSETSEAGESSEASEASESSEEASKPSEDN